MNNLNLYPYNFWILYGTIAITIIAFILIISKLFNLIKKINIYQPQINNINVNVNNINIKKNIVENSINSKVNTVKKFLPYLISLYFFSKNLKDSTEPDNKKTNTNLKNPLKKSQLTKKDLLIKTISQL